MKITLIVAGCLVGIVLLILIIGFLLPKNHVAKRTIELKVTPTQIWETITDYNSFPNWRDDIDSVKGSGKSWVESGKNGEIPFKIIEEVPFKKLVTQIDDKTLPFGGSWTYEIENSNRGTQLTITENGEVYNPIFRFMSRFVFGHYASIDQYNKSLKYKYKD